MTVKAWGKVILCGEHAVVYGVPALAVAIQSGVEARAERLAEGPSQLHVHGNLPVREGDGSELGRALQVLLTHCVPSSPVAIFARSELPLAAGLGASAALGVSIVRAVAELEKRSLSPVSVADQAMAWERVFHGNPSGVDTAVSAAGGALLFSRSSGAEEVPVGAPFELVIGHSGVTSSTRRMVERLAQLRARSSVQVDAAFDRVRGFVSEARAALENGDRSSLGGAMNRNHEVLVELGLSTPELDRMCVLARENGALGAKLTGAGGGGCAIALCHRGAEGIARAWEKEGFSAFVTTVTGNELPSTGRMRVLSPRNP